MSEEKKSDQSKGEAIDPKAKYLEALEKKRQCNGVRKNNIAGGPKVSGGGASGKTPKMFRRKSGSA
jgi:hypothetical protein